MKEDFTFRNNPLFSKELHPTKNVGLTHYGEPIDVLDLSCGTDKKLWWLCSTCEHEWLSKGYDRLRGRGCPACANKVIHIDGRNSMARTHPELAKELLNEDATKITAGTNKKLDWKCSICEHEWKTSGGMRVCGRGCPACSNHVVHIDGRNSMAKTHPNLAKEYQGDATKITAGTDKKLDWKCSTCEHEWKAIGSNRKKGIGCPACSNKVIHIDGRNSMAKTHPELAKEYQGDATKIVAGTKKKLDWKCSTCEHEWKAHGDRRTNYGSGCPFCSGRSVHIDGRNSMAKTHPELAKELLNEDATKIKAGTHKKLDWKCSTCEHEWKTSGDIRVCGRGCPACANRVIHMDGRNSMARTHPELAKEYQGDATKITAGTNKKLDWKCSTCEHEWKSIATTRTRKTILEGVHGCPACANRAIHIDGRNSMAKTHSELAKEYQGDATKITAGTNKKLDWKCSTCDHEWKASAINRSNGKGCPSCANQAINSYDARNSMAKTHPELAKEYQGDAKKIFAGTHKKLDWKCSTCEHEWKAVGSSRFAGTGCPACAKTGYDPSSIGYVYILEYDDGLNHWLKCGITNIPKVRFSKLRASAKKHNITIREIDIYTFDDGWNAQFCERELLECKEIRYESPYPNLDGRSEFFKADALEEIKKIVERF